MAERDDSDAWFAPKRNGYGAGLPIRRQGWAVVVGYSLLIPVSALLIPYSRVAFAAIVLAATAALILICARKTRGGFHWRWGGKG
jgi:hypothetical protein